MVWPAANTRFVSFEKLDCARTLHFWYNPIDVLGSYATKRNSDGRAFCSSCRYVSAI